MANSQLLLVWPSDLFKNCFPSLILSALNPSFLSFSFKAFTLKIARTPVCSIAYCPFSPISLSGFSQPSLSFLHLHPSAAAAAAPRWVLCVSGRECRWASSLQEASVSSEAGRCGRMESAGRCWSSGGTFPPGRTRRASAEQGHPAEAMTTEQVSAVGNRGVWEPALSPSDCWKSARPPLCHGALCSAL